VKPPFPSISIPISLPCPVLSCPLSPVCCPRPLALSLSHTHADKQDHWLVASQASVEPSVSGVGADSSSSLLECLHLTCLHPDQPWSPSSVSITKCSVRLGSRTWPLDSPHSLCRLGSPCSCAFCPKVLFVLRVTRRPEPDLQIESVRHGVSWFASTVQYYNNYSVRDPASVWHVPKTPPISRPTGIATGQSRATTTR
jgi:hypothetical protein